MKYRRLTKEQFEALHEDFAKFLASQQVDVREWETIKKEKPEVAEEELNVFSDLVWEDVLTKTEYLEHFSKNQLNLFKCEAEEIHRILVSVKDDKINLLEKEGMDWFIKNPKHDAIDYFKASKKYEKERNIEIFKLIEMGSEITKGDLFESVLQLIS